MAVSSSTDFSQVFTELFTDARRELGVNAEEEPVDATELQNGLRVCNRMLKAWEADGVMAWTYAEGTLTLVASDESYTVQAGGDITVVPMDIVQMRITRSGTDLEMRRMSREEYYAIPNKTATGYPTQYFYDRQRDTGVLKVWPAPDATGGTLKFTYRRRIMDMDAGSDNFDIPQEWYEAVCLGLASRLIGHYGKAGTDEAKRVEREAANAFLLIKAYDTGEGENSIYITPSPYRRR
jgi:hypothetical protein